MLEYTKLGGRRALAARGMTDFNSGMPGFESAITDGEIWDILAYIRSTWPEREQQAQASRNPPHE
ncbi:c-type cytochrome [uncultured Tateyamaria sp.]|uniref:c-type cytochrome n=1 Tax=uncultured Tateyamaria sp. TaxID=455651 RepID=UPI0034309AD8